MRVPAPWIQAALAALVALGVVVQAHLIAAYIFGAGHDAPDAHEAVGNVTHGVEVLVFLAGLAAWWGRWPMVALAFALPALGVRRRRPARGVGRDIGRRPRRRGRATVGRR